jgi:hypothetical protein
MSQLNAFTALTPNGIIDAETFNNLKPETDRERDTHTHTERK